MSQEWYSSIGDFDPHSLPSGAQEQYRFDFPLLIKGVALAVVTSVINKVTGRAGVTFESQHEATVKRLRRQIEDQKLMLDYWRDRGDSLRIDLAEESLNNLLDRLYRLSHVTSGE